MDEQQHTRSYSFFSDCQHCDSYTLYSFLAAAQNLEIYHTLISVCRGYTEGVVPPINDKQRYEYYKQLYMNCTYVLENLNITTLYGKFDLSFLKDIEEVMGYVYIEMVDSNYLNLTNLRIIRGETLHKGCSLYLSWNVNIFRYRDGLMELQFTSLSGRYC